jgi:hypothetical protein
MRVSLLIPYGAIVEKIYCNSFCYILFYLSFTLFSLLLTARLLAIEIVLQTDPKSAIDNFNFKHSISIKTTAMQSSETPNGTPR